jgi:hypothetical protein
VKEIEKHKRQFDFAGKPLLAGKPLQYRLIYPRLLNKS